MRDVAAVTALLLLAGCHTAPVQDTAEPLGPPPEFVAPDQVGPYGVGATTYSFTDARGTELTVEIWYPAIVDDQAEADDYGDFSLAWDAHRDAPPDLRGGPYPVVAFSHGYGGVRYQTAFLTERLASHGFVVVAPDHPFGTLFDLDSDRTSEVAIGRPTDVSSALTAILELPADHLVADVGLDGPMGMIGHSFGAWTTLVVGGGVLDLDFAKAHCAAQNDPGCRFIADLADLDSVAGAVPDERVIVTAALAPGGAYAFGTTGLLDVADPLVIGGRMDGDLPYDNEIRPVFDALGDPKTLITLERAGHWAFTDLCVLVPTVVDCAGEAGGFMETEVVRDVSMTLVTAHLRNALYGHDLASWLVADAWVDESDVTVE